MPLECQRPGYVGIGLSLSKSGEIRSNWIARSTYGRDCPVEQCMAEVAAGWFFEPLPESMQIVLPVQVLRTDKPLVRSEMASLPVAPLPSSPPVAAMPGAAGPASAVSSDFGRVATVE
jgi:hypothetical protein